MNECEKNIITSDYVYIDEVDLLNMSIEERSTLTEAIKVIDNTFSNLKSIINFKTIITNEGSGVPLYKGYSDKRGHSFSTLKGDGTIDIKEVDNEIFISVSKDQLNGGKYEFENIGPGAGIYRGKRKEGDSEIISLKTLFSEDLYIENGDDVITINLSKELRDNIEYLNNFVPSNYKKAFNDKYDK